jgi:hypothetical protein
MEEGCLTCHNNISQTNMPFSTFHTIWKPLMGTKIPSWFYNVSTYDGKVIEYWTFLKLKIHLNKNYKLQFNLDMILVLLESPWWVGFNEGDFFNSKI